MSSPGCTSYRTRAPMLPPPGSLPGLYRLRLTLLSQLPVSAFLSKGRGLCIYNPSFPSKPPRPVPSPDHPLFPFPPLLPGEHLFVCQTQGSITCFWGIPQKRQSSPGLLQAPGLRSGQDTSPPACWLVSRSLRAGPAQSPCESRGAGHGRDGHGVPAVDRRAGVGRERVGRWATLC